jgi:hypothetical protein
MRSLFVFLLCACGATPYLEPSRADSPLVQGPAAPVDCPALCVRVKPQLVRDFGITDAEVDCSAPDYAAARNCAACDEVFQRRFGTKLTHCQ